MRIPEKVIRIGGSAFSLCPLETVMIPGSVEEIGDMAFSGCGELSAIEVAPENRSYRSVDGVLFSADGKSIICYPGGRKGSYQIPEGVETIGSYAFSGSYYLSDVTIPDSVVKIGFQAFSFCAELKSVTIPNGVRVIDTEAFSYCDEIKEITIPASVVSIEKDAFTLCGRLSKINVEPDNQHFKAIDGVLFTADGKKLICYPVKKPGASYVIPDGVSEICSLAFADSDLSRITIPESVVKIDYGVFSECESLKSVDYGGSRGSWGTITIQDENDPLKNADIRYAAS